ncbi:hypothetical protein OG426_22860 [Streptomyces canus]|uniref:hypothetical protein n=1 Tax=Streptomyces canus TaxID=58343 RepID=UPI0038632C7E|nr:hypothetical protein OG426_22860 [Streptomyces canus]
MKVTLQFHGGRREIYAMAWEWARELGMPLAEERFAPTYQVKLVGGGQESGATPECGDDVRRISLNPPPVDLNAASSLEYAKKNPDSLFITLGGQSDAILRESVLSAMTDEVTLVAAWKKLRERARKSMLKGAWAENTMSGARSRAANHYYTAEAKSLADAGVTLMGGTDWIKYQLD